MIQTSECRHDINWLAYKLGINTTEVEKIITNLTNIDLIKFENGQYKVKSSGTQIHVDHKTTQALKKLQFEANLLSRMSLENESIEKRFHGTNTLTIDPNKITEAKEFIREFRRRFCKSLDWKGHQARVYQLNISLYPLDMENS